MHAQKTAFFSNLFVSVEATPASSRLRKKASRASVNMGGHGSGRRKLSPEEKALQASKYKAT
jgi:hypothetical protein